MMETRTILRAIFQNYPKLKNEPRQKFNSFIEKKRVKEKLYNQHLSSIQGGSRLYFGHKNESRLQLYGLITNHGQFLVS